MSSTAKIIIAIVVIVLVGAGLYFWNQSSNNTANQGGTSMGDSTALPSGSSTSDAALNQDAAAINANIQGVSSDSANVNQSVNAQSSGSDF